MRQFLKAFLCFLFLLLITSAAVNIALRGYKYYGNRTFESKLDCVKQLDSTANYFFFGSSRIATGIDPVHFDSILQKRSRIARSYNMATYGSWFSETQYLLTHFLDETTLNKATIFVELQHVMSVEWGKIDTDKNIYYQSWDHFKFIYATVSGRNNNSVRSKFAGAHYMVSYSLSEIFELLNLGKSDCLIPKATIDSFDTHGFRALRPSNGPKINPLKYHDSMIRGFASSAPYNRAVVNTIIHQISHAASRNVKLIFILTPKNYTDELATVYKAIPRNNRLDYEEMLENKDLFVPSLWTDNTHLNAKGARLYTQMIADQYTKHN